MNKLYGESTAWDALSLTEKIEYIRKHLCTGPCGSSMQVMTQRERINAVLKQVLAILLEDKEDV